MDQMAFSGGAIIILEPLPQRMRCDTDDRIHLRVKVMGPAQGLHGNAVLFDFVDRSFEVLFANKAQKSNKIVRSAQHAGGQN